ncbi:Cinnamyl alcohol dehydrogenase-like protein, partial [Pseudomonas savastanoi]
MQVCRETAKVNEQGSAMLARGVTYSSPTEQVTVMVKTYSYAAQSAQEVLKPYQFERRSPGAEDVQIDILYCGVCHSDLHTARNEWHNTLYPSVPGHEIVGRVTAVGADVKHFKVGDLAGVGCMVDSCQQCTPCAEGDEQYCESGFTGTYTGPVFGGENT